MKALILWLKIGPDVLGKAPKVEKKLPKVYSRDQISSLWNVVMEGMWPAKWTLSRARLNAMTVDAAPSYCDHDVEHAVLDHQPGRVLQPFLSLRSALGLVIDHHL